MTPERQRLLDYLRRYGLRGEMIQADTHDEDGFYALNPIIGEYSDPIPWPKDLNYDWLCRLEQVAKSADFSDMGRTVYNKWIREQDV